MSLRAGAIVALSVIALAGASVAGLEKALNTRDDVLPPPVSAAQPPGPAAAPGFVPAPPAPGLEIPGPPVPGPPTAGAGSALTLPADPAAPPPCAPPVRVCVQLSTSSAWLLTDDAGARGPVPVRHGRPDSPTPVGTFPVESKDAEHVNTSDGSPMPFSVFFAKDFALYQAELTEPSAGSVRLAPGAAEAFFDTVAVGDLIQVVP